MQAAAAGIAAGALASGAPVLLAGGTQMIAVAALLRRLAGLGFAPDPGGLLAVGTTRWVVDDPTADASGLMRDVGDEPLLATPLSFADSPHAQLRRYEDYLVKEGVGAGGAVIAAAITANIDCAQIAQRVETMYEQMFLVRN
jgi:NaMN:DMB phosphoribosyltransferase